MMIANVACKQGTSCLLQTCTVHISQIPTRSAVRHIIMIVAIGVLLSAPLFAASSVEFIPLGDLPGGAFESHVSAISDDGKVVVGYSVVDEGRTVPYRWTEETGMVGLAPFAGDSTWADDVSSDGTVVVGHDNGSDAFRWSIEAGLEIFPTKFVGWGASGDGSVMVGHAIVNAGDEDQALTAVLWSDPTGLIPLVASTKDQWSQARDVSSDGTVVVGGSSPRSQAGDPFLTGLLASEAFVWTEAAGVQHLGDLEGGDFGSMAFAVSPEGGAVVGISTRSAWPDVEPFLWTEEAGMLGLGPFPGRKNAWPQDASLNGSVVVGFSRDDGAVELPREEIESRERAFVWDHIQGMRILQTVLDSYGLTESLSGWTLTRATAISPNGLHVTGQGINPNGDLEGWLVHLDPSSIDPRLVGDFDGNGILDAGDIDLLSADVRDAAGNLAYDVNADGVVNQADRDDWIKTLRKTWIGDADLDSEFNSGDLVNLFAAGTYQADVDAVWSTGDFDGNGRFNSSDLVKAFSDGGYDRGPRIALAVPEPTGVVGLALGCLYLAACRWKCIFVRR